MVLRVLTILLAFSVVTSQLLCACSASVSTRRCCSATPDAHGEKATSKAVCCGEKRTDSSLTHKSDSQPDHTGRKNCPHCSGTSFLVHDSGSQTTASMDLVPMLWMAPLCEGLAQPAAVNHVPARRNSPPVERPSKTLLGQFCALNS